MIARGRPLWWLAAAALIAVAAASPRLVPYNMDEFVHYQALGCLAASQQASVPSFRDGCFHYDLRLPGTDRPLPLRSYAYIGSFPSLPFYPFWRAIDDPVAARIQGAVLFLAWFVLTLRLIRVRPGALLFASLLLPVFVVSFVVDEGPVGLAAVLLAAALLGLRRALGEGRGRLGWAAAAGLLLFLGLWSKLVFACLFPTVAAFVIGQLRQQQAARAPSRSGWLPLAIAALAFVAPTALLLGSIDGDGLPYAASLRGGKLSLDPAAVAGRFVHLTRLTADPTLVAPRNLLPVGSPLDALPAMAGVTLIAVAWVRRSARRSEIAAGLGLGLFTLAGLALSEFCQWPHHAFYGLLGIVFALALAAEALGAKERLALAAVVIVIWAGLVPRLAAAVHPGESSPAKDEMLRFVRERGLDRTSLQVHTTWGTYYIAQLFGDRERIVLYPRRISDDPRRMETVRQLGRRVGRPLLVSSARRPERFQNPEVDRLFGRPVSSWRFGDWWVALYDPDGLAAETPRQHQPAVRASAGSRRP